MTVFSLQFDYFLSPPSSLFASLLRPLTACIGGDECLYNTSTARELQANKRQWVKDYAFLEQRRDEMRENLRIAAEQADAEELARAVAQAEEQRK